MFFKRFYDSPLAQASYLIGCQRTGEAIVVDPNRDVQQYLDAAAAEGLRVSHVTETHIHADFVSGARELAKLSGAQLLLSGEGGPDWQYAYAAGAGARLLKDGDRIAVGNIVLDVLHSPGHTPEHISFIVTDRPASEAPWGILTGDFVFVGDVGRPDLLERAAGHQGTMEAAAHTLFKSLARFRALPDHVQVWPGHGAGSACGKALGAIASSTIGYEKIANWGVAETDEETFVRSVLDGQPEPPRYFAEMKRINKAGPRLLDRVGGAFPTVARLSSSAIEAMVDEHRIIVDTRPAAAFAAGHVPGTLSIPLDGTFTTWAGWLLPYDREVYLLVNDGKDVAAAARDLAMIGLDQVGGWLGADTLTVWKARGKPLETVEQASPTEVAALLAGDAVQVIDVRGHAEWASGHLVGVPNIPVGYLGEHIADLRTDRPIVVQCQSGVRSSIAAGLLLSKGLRRVINLTGGFVAWQRAGLPITV